jgi:hypothetical protein
MAAITAVVKYLSPSRIQKRLIRSMSRRRSQKVVHRWAALIRSEVLGTQDAWIFHGVDRIGTTEYENYLLTLSALNHIQTRLSPGRYRMQYYKRGRVPSDIAESLRSAAGICGQQSQAMIDVMREFGCVARPVGFYFVGPFADASNHAAVEVAWGGRWHFVDLTNGAVFRRPGSEGPALLSIAEILKIPNPLGLAVLNNTNLDFQMMKEFGSSPLDYLTRDPDVVIDGEGAVRLRVLEDGDRFGFQLVGAPNYVGSTPASNGGYGWLRLLLPVNNPVDGLEMLVSAVTDAAGLVGTLRVHSDLGDWEAPINASMSRVDLPVRASAGHVELSVLAPASKPFRVVFKSLSLRRAG